jgi:hypothetical protein
MVSGSSACSSSSPRDAKAPDVFEEAGGLDVLQDVGARDEGPRDAEAPDAVRDGEALDADQDTEACLRICALGTALGCTDITCVSQCRQDLASGICHAEKRALQLCVIAAGTDAVFCVLGRPATKAGYCVPEKDALTLCLAGPSGDAGSD